MWCEPFNDDAIYEIWQQHNFLAAHTLDWIPHFERHNFHFLNTKLFFYKRTKNISTYVQSEPAFFRHVKPLTWLWVLICKYIQIEHNTNERDLVDFFGLVSFFEHLWLLIILKKTQMFPREAAALQPLTFWTVRLHIFWSRLENYLICWLTNFSSFRSSRIRSLFHVSYLSARSSRA